MPVSSAGVPVYATMTAGLVVAGLITTVAPSTTAETLKSDLVAPVQSVDGPAGLESTLGPSGRATVTARPTVDPSPAATGGGAHVLSRSSVAESKNTDTFRKPSRTFSTTSLSAVVAVRNAGKNIGAALLPSVLPSVPLVPQMPSPVQSVDLGPVLPGTDIESVVPAVSEPPLGTSVMGDLPETPEGVELALDHPSNVTGLSVPILLEPVAPAIATQDEVAVVEPLLSGIHPSFERAVPGEGIGLPAVPPAVEGELPTVLDPEPTTVSAFLEVQAPVEVQSLDPVALPDIALKVTGPAVLDTLQRPEIPADHGTAGEADPAEGEVASSVPEENLSLSVKEESQLPVEPETAAPGGLPAFDVGIQFDLTTTVPVTPTVTPTITAAEAAPDQGVS